MGQQLLDDKCLFLSKNRITDAYKKAELIDNKIWNELQKIDINYNEYSKNCNAIAQRVLFEILDSSELKDIHSARYRVKDKNSLLVKIVKKKSKVSLDESYDYDIEKYRNLNSSNYYKIMTDLIGIRILIRYREQWVMVHDWIMNKYYKGDEHFIKNHLNDYTSHPNESFIAEKPKLYYRNRNDLYFYEQVGRDVFEPIESKEGYNSIHYIINIDGKYIELQVRTIFDEAWCESTHDVVYKNKNKKLEKELNYLSICLAQQTISAEYIANLMYSKVNSDGDLSGSVSKLAGITPISQNETKDDVKTSKPSSIKQRINQLNKAKINEDDFDGDISKLI